MSYIRNNILWEIIFTRLAFLPVLQQYIHCVVQNYAVIKWDNKYSVAFKQKFKKYRKHTFIDETLDDFRLRRSGGLMFY